MYGRLPKLITEYRGLISYKEVTVRANRKCRLCGKEIQKGERCITSFERVFFKEEFDDNLRYYDLTESYHRALRESGRLVRKWQCNNCSIKLKQVIKEDKALISSALGTDDMIIED